MTLKYLTETKHRGMDPNETFQGCPRICFYLWNARPTDLHTTFAEVSSGKNRCAFDFCCLIYSRVSNFRQLANSIYLTSCFEYLRRARSRNKRHS